MRWNVILFFLGSLPMLAGEAGDAALKLMKDLRDPLERSKIEGKLGISRFCGPIKRELIEDHWDKRASWAGEGDYSFELLDEKVDENLGAVLVGATTPDSPDLSVVISLAMIKRDGEWKVAPVEGRFENVGLGFEVGVKTRTKDLELWLAHERIGAASRLRLQEIRKFRKEMDGAVSEEDLRGLGPEKVLERFIEAAESGNTNAMIVWQGYFERDEFPDVDWEQSLRVTRLGMAGKDKQKVWRLLTSKKIMKVILADEEEDSKILIGFLSSFETGTMNDHLNPIRFPMKKTKAGWRVSLPMFFSLADESQRAFRNARNRNFNWEDRTGVKRMFGVFEDRYKKIREKEAKAVVEGLIGDLRKSDLDTFLRRQYRYIEPKKEDENEDADDEEVEIIPRRFGRRGQNEPDDKRKEIYLEAVKWWNGALKGRDAAEAELSEIYVEGENALAILSLPPSSDTWKPVYQKLWLRKGDDGWMILPGENQPMKLSYPAEQKESVAKLTERYAVEIEKITEAFLQNVLKVVELESGKGKAATEDEAFRLVKEWRKTARTAGMIPLLKASAVRKIPNEAKVLLRNVGYLRKEAASSEKPDRVLGSHAVGRYRAVSLATIVGGGSEMKCPMLIVVPVKDGHRVLVDIELPLETNRGLSLLNEERMEVLADELAKEDLAAIAKLREWHEKKSRPVWDAWVETQEALEK